MAEFDARLQNAAQSLSVQDDPGEILEWDSKFWGFRVARVRCNLFDLASRQRVDRWCRGNKVRCAYCLTPTGNPPTMILAEHTGFRHVDVRVTLVKRSPTTFGSTSDTTAPAVIRLACPDDLPTLQRIARYSYTDSRFYHDPHFDRERCDAFYDTWITRSVHGSADAVLVAELEGRPCGYATCHLDRGDGRIGLVGVDSAVQGRGVGYQLISGAIDWFAIEGAEKISVVTQKRNRTAQRLYRRCGFVTDSLSLWHHKWYHDPE